MGLTAVQAAEIIDATPNAVYRLVSKGALAKPVKHQHGGLQLEDVEAASLQRYRPSRRHPYWCRTREAAAILGLSTTRVQQLTAEGRLPYVEQAGVRLYRRPQLEIIANARETRRLTARGHQLTGLRQGSGPR